ncbi:PH domain-containing protein [Nocardioides dilutus]
MSELQRDQDWQRLDPRMLLVHPVREVIRFLPALIAIVFAGQAAGGQVWQAFGIVIPIAIGLLRYLTTSFRVAAGRVELRRGLVSRHVLSTPVERVRTVDLTSSLIQRALGLTTLRVGTGTASTSDDEKLDLDGLPVARARELRSELLRVSVADDGAPSAIGPAPMAEEVVAAFEPSWLKYAPLTGSGVIIAAAALGLGAQFLEILGFWEDVDAEDYESLSGPTLPLVVLVPLGVLVALVVTSALAIGGYLVTNWAFRVSRRPPGPGGDWHLSRGLFTTRETTLDDDRVAGVTLTEAIGVRAAGGARLSAIVTGLDRSEQGSSTLVPPAPRATVERTAAAVLGVGSPVSGPLVPHGPAAVRRRWTRAMVPAALGAVAAAVAVVLGQPVWLLTALVALPVAALLAADRVRALGHALVDGHVVARAGSVVRRRRVLHTDHVIGWNFRATWFQRRVGLTTLVATTAGGGQAVPVLDIPEDLAVELAQRALPDLVSQFRAS